MFIVHHQGKALNLSNVIHFAKSGTHQINIQEAARIANTGWQWTFDTTDERDRFFTLMINIGNESKQHIRHLVSD